jgi:alpha-ketoglutarate-dependent taurine dioxygenase
MFVAMQHVTKPIRRAARGGASLFHRFQSNMGVSNIVAAQTKGTDVDVKFSDGNAFRFHALWLRDACRDSNHVSAKAGERILTMTPLGAGCPPELAATSAMIREDGSMSLQWSDASSESCFTSEFLRSYGPNVAQPLTDIGQSISSLDLEWLKPYNGVPGSLAPSDDQIEMWRNGPDNVHFPSFDRASLTVPEVNLQLIKALLRHGVVLVDGVPDAEGATALHEFCSACLGGLQKDPAREEANWTIVKKDGAASISYNQDLRLNQHTDQSIPAHGIPALALVVHYKGGRGMNTLTDGFACAQALRERDPEAFRLLTMFGNDQERDFIRSRVDAAGNHNQSLLISTQAPMLQLDPEGKLMRLQYNEVFRTPSTLPYDAFPKWFRAYRQFVDMVHSPEFEREVHLKAGQILVMQNWRVMHGRGSNGQSPDRTLVGGTVVREAIFSRARQLAGEISGKELFGVGLFSA